MAFSGKVAEEKVLAQRIFSGRMRNTHATVAYFTRCAIEYFVFIYTVFDSTVFFIFTF